MDTSAPSPVRFFGRAPRSLYALLLIMFLVRVAVDVTPNNEFDGHPIDKLMVEATALHNAWSRQIATSKTLSEAVVEYRRRYKRQPPPHFDKWYEYATSRNSLIIDDFDSIYEDLLPFWAFEPQDLRARTREILSDPWNEVAEVTIRSGSAEIGESLVPTHRWMVAGAIEMMKDFIGWLPDMDLALNINDESRVAIPHEGLQNYRKIGVAAGRSNSIAKDNIWSTNRAQSWELEEEPRRMFEDASFTNTFYNYGSTSCPPDSPARRRHIWDHRTLCTSCFSPHSIGPFLRNWTLSASPCHQPDLTSLHGFYLSPGAFKTAHQPIPVFSQSKAHGYADILYPSPWNYMDKVKYEPSPADDAGENARPDPPFSEKKNTLFWRGATSEGVSIVGTWKGMARQRLVHLANNHTSNIPILLPKPSDPSKQEYESLSPKEIKVHPYLQNTTMDIAIVDLIVRCRDNCPPQEAEFGLVPPIEFQEHWRYRYLMDMDGAGFSGRFLPFLQSHSLVFKTALFREWYDTRITAWRHFVPIDLRLHGLWSTLAYFAGGGKDGDGNAGRVKEAETIAEQGREWVGKVLRKEDMEIYFFRLLLEWGRLTDDRRDEIGFEMPSL
ncbi:hypothetical protein MMC27_005511 [Xylographa pallens]|nr:hypothetical protein [Xylographa pallens]